MRRSHEMTEYLAPTAAGIGDAHGEVPDPFAHSANSGGYPRLPMPHSYSGPFSDTQMVIAFPAGATSRNVRVTIRASAIT